MNTLTLTRVYKTNTKKDGTPLVSAKGKPYTRMSIQTQEHGEKWLSGFAGSWNETWAEGNVLTVGKDIEIKQNGEYLNFERVDKTVQTEARMKKLEDRVAKLEEQMGSPIEMNIPEGLPEDVPE